MADKDDKAMQVSATPARQPAETERTFTPLVDAYEHGDTVVLEAELPGAVEKDVDITVEKGVLTISAPAQVDEPGEAYAETFRGFAGGRYYRRFALSDEIDRENISASMDSGVLTLKLPKAAQARTRKIEVKS